jgi:dTDP-4-dehydrorhamnose reductase
MHQETIIKKLSLLAPKRVLVTGGHGMLGNSFRRQLAKYIPHCLVEALGKNELDVRNIDQVMGHAEWLQDGWIIHSAALVNVEGCAQDPTLARETILMGAQNMISLAKATRARLFYPQSFLIYDGSNEFISEKVEPNPLSLYGQLKYQSEINILEALENPLIVRMAGFFGGNEKDKNFVGKIIRHMSELIEGGVKQIQVGDRIWQPTWTDDLALNSLLLMATGQIGTFQMACHGTASFYQLTKEIVRILSWEENIDVIPVSERDVSSTELGRRPAKAELDCRRLMESGHDLQRPWQIALKEYLSDSYFDQYRRLSKNLNLKGGAYERVTSRQL